MIDTPPAQCPVCLESVGLLPAVEPSLAWAPWLLCPDTATPPIVQILAPSSLRLPYHLLPLDLRTGSCQEQQRYARGVALHLPL